MPGAADSGTGNSAKPLSEVAGSAYSTLIKDQLAEERARKTSLEQRGIQVVTTSGVLSTLLFGLATFAKSSSSLSLFAGVCLLASLVCFAMAFIFGLRANRGYQYDEASTDSLRELTSAEEWNNEHPAGAERRVSKLYVDILEHARKQNGKKADRLNTALTFEVAALIGVALAVASVIIQVLGAAK